MRKKAYFPPQSEIILTTCKIMEELDFKSPNKVDGGTINANEFDFIEDDTPSGVSSNLWDE